jgi:hypothetical protein
LCIVGDSVTPIRFADERRGLACGPLPDEFMQPSGMLERYSM